MSDSKWKQTQAGGEKSRDGKMGDHRSSWKPCAFSFSSLFFHCKAPFGVFALVWDHVMCDAAYQSRTAESKPQWPQDCWWQGKKLCERYSSQSHSMRLFQVFREKSAILCATYQWWSLHQDTWTGLAPQCHLTEWQFRLLTVKQPLEYVLSWQLNHFHSHRACFSTFPPL